MSKKWHGGKGDECRINNFAAYQLNHEKVFSKKTCQEWASFDKLKDDHPARSVNDATKISYSSFVNLYLK